MDTWALRMCLLYGGGITLVWDLVGLAMLMQTALVTPSAQIKCSKNNIPHCSGERAMQESDDVET